MTSELLKWIAAALVLAVLTLTLWMAHAARPEQGGPSLMLAHAEAVPAAVAASAPAAP